MGGKTLKNLHKTHCLAGLESLCMIEYLEGYDYTNIDNSLVYGALIVTTTTEQLTDVKLSFKLSCSFGLSFMPSM